MIELESGVLYAHPVVAIFFAQWTQTKLTLFVTSIMMKWMENQNPVDDGEINSLTTSLQKSEAKIQELQTVIQQIEKVINPRKEQEEKNSNKRGEIERLISEYAQANNISSDWAWQNIYSDFCHQEQMPLYRPFNSFATELDYLEQQPQLMNKVWQFVKVYLKQKDLSSYEMFTFKEENNHHHVDCF